MCISCSSRNVSAMGIIEDVLMKVDMFYFPVAFIVIDTVPVHN